MQPVMIYCRPNVESSSGGGARRVSRRAASSKGQTVSAKGLSLFATIAMVCAPQLASAQHGSGMGGHTGGGHFAGGHLSGSSHVVTPSSGGLHFSGDRPSGPPPVGAGTNSLQAIPSAPNEQTTSTRDGDLGMTDTGTMARRAVRNGSTTIGYPPSDGQYWHKGSNSGSLSFSGQGSAIWQSAAVKSRSEFEARGAGVRSDRRGRFHSRDRLHFRRRFPDLGPFLFGGFDFLDCGDWDFDEAWEGGLGYGEPSCYDWDAFQDELDAAVSSFGAVGGYQEDGETQALQGAARTTPPVTLCLKDGSAYEVRDYWFADGQLHYMTSYGGENSVPPELIDFQRTVDENAARGVTFTLQPAPSR